jgi:hypothetical protein
MTSSGIMAGFFLTREQSVREVAAPDRKAATEPVTRGPTSTPAD